jgi:hypothetical protein
VNPGKKARTKSRTSSLPALRSRIGDGGGTDTSTTASSANSATIPSSSRAFHAASNSRRTASGSVVFSESIAARESMSVVSRRQPNPILGLSAPPIIPPNSLPAHPAGGQPPT